VVSELALELGPPFGGVARRTLRRDAILAPTQSTATAAVIVARIAASVFAPLEDTPHVDRLAGDREQDQTGCDVAQPGRSPRRRFRAEVCGQSEGDVCH
jgi:hypothetical protein